MPLPILTAEGGKLFKRQIIAALEYLDGLASGLSGLTATVTELNYTDGVTSPIQTQLDGKLSSIADGSVTFAKLDGAAVITSGEGIRSNDSDTAVTTSAAVIDVLGPQLQTAQTASSNTAFDFTGIPTWVNRITVMGRGLSTNGTSNYTLRVGDGAIVTTGYAGSVTAIAGATPTSGTGTVGATVLTSPTAASVFRFEATISRVTGNEWTITGVGSLSNTNTTTLFAFDIALSGALDRVRFTTIAGTDTFDAGDINISWE